MTRKEKGERVKEKREISREKGDRKREKNPFYHFLFKTDTLCSCTMCVTNVHMCTMYQFLK